MSGIDDEALRRHFEALRETDLARVPPFDALSRRPASSDRMRSTPAPWVLAGGLGALAAAAMLAVLTQRRHEEAEWLHAAAAISAWQAPTDALLEIPDRSLLGGAPTLGASVLDSIIPPFRED